MPSCPTPYPGVPVVCPSEADRRPIACSRDPAPLSAPGRHVYPRAVQNNALARSGPERRTGDRCVSRARRLTASEGRLTADDSRFRMFRSRAGELTRGSFIRGLQEREGITTVSAARRWAHKRREHHQRSQHSTTRTWRPGRRRSRVRLPCRSPDGGGRWESNDGGAEVVQG